MCTNNERHEMIKEEANTREAKIISTKASSSTSPSPWLRLRDPRIVRVSRAFGGKDRHSKVSTIRGLRDRRVRLSVPTAIQLYDLQDRLGLNQPSKVVDWLLDQAKDEIDELPPLPPLPTAGNFGLNHQEIDQSNNEVLRIEGSSTNWEGACAEGLLRPSNAWSSEALWRAKSKETARESTGEKENWTKINDEEKQGVNEGGHGAEASSINFLPRSSNPFINVLPFGSYYRLEPSSFPFSQMGSHGFQSQTEDLHNFNVVPLPSALSLSSSGSQILECPPPPGATQPFFPSHVDEIDPRRQINHFQMFSPSSHNLFANSLSQTPQTTSQSLRPFHFGMTSRFLPSHDGTAGDHSDKDQGFPSK